MRRLAVTALMGLLVVGGLAVTVTLEPARADSHDLEPGSIERGVRLYQVGCATCHGDSGEGVDGWPPIMDAGAASADFQLRTGRMPYAQERGQQAQRKPPAYGEQEIRDLVAFVASLGDGPAIPEFALDAALLSPGQRLFASNCAPCHGASGNGGALGGGAIAWPLTDAPPLIVAEAMITGPGQMPIFDWPQEDLNATVTYVEYLRSAPSPGGFSIGGIGPVPEGLVAWFVGMAGLAAVVYLVGREWDRNEDGG